ncbi:MAG: FHA domain-containing serine/threonine-protein kinase [Planctomycetaceae bacterium]
MFRLNLPNGTLIDLPDGQVLLIGRGDQCDLKLDDPSVSRVHCRLCVDGRSVFLSDPGSRWGTTVNGEPVRECELKSGDRIVVGESILILHHDNADGAQTTLAPRKHTAANQNNEDDRQFRATPSAQQRQAVMQPIAAQVDPDRILGQTFHRYRPQQALARTSTGVVFRALEQSSGLAVALKLFHPLVFSDERSEQRFERAVRTMFGRRHPGIVALLNAGKHQGFFFTVSQLINGESAVDLIRRIGVAGMLDPPAVLQIAVDLCEALRFAEEHKIVHRNIKPSNILVRRTDHAALLNDLVLARATQNSDAQLTQAGEVLGDVCYHSPEQLGSGQPIDHRSDIYQLGASLYALLTGRPPIDGTTLSEAVTRVMTESPISIRQQHMAVPAQLDAVVLKMLAKNPRDRFQTADELSVALRKVAAETGQAHVKPRLATPDNPGWAGALDGLF